MLHGTKRARVARHGNQTRWSRPSETRAADLSRCWCGRASADGVGRSAPRVGPQHNHSKSARCGTCVMGGRPILHGANRAQAVRHWIQTRRKKIFQSPCRRPVAVMVRSSLPRPTALSGAHPALAHNTATPSPHCAARAPWTVRNYPTGRKVRGPHATGLICDENKLLYPVPPTCRGKCD